MAKYYSSFRCAHEGCTEMARYEADTRKEQTAQQVRYYNKWKCVRHTDLDTVLSPTNRVLVSELPTVRRFSDRGIDIGLYFGGHSGFSHGPGFKAFAKDFPEGTVLRVTAEIILPDDLPPTHVHVEGEDDGY